MPAIKLSGQVSDLQVVPEAYRDKYEKVGDGFVLKEIEIEDTTGLLASVKATRTERDAALAKLKPFESFDVDGYNTWLADKDNAAAADSKKKGDWDAREAQIKKTNDAALKAKDDQAARLNQALRRRQSTFSATARDSIHCHQGRERDVRRPRGRCEWCGACEFGRQSHVDRRKDFRAESRHTIRGRIRCVRIRRDGKSCRRCRLGTRQRWSKNNQARRLQQAEFLGTGPAHHQRQSRAG